MELLPEPLPERVVAMIFNPSEHPRRTFSLGVCLRTEDNAGVKMEPTHEVCFVVDGQSFGMAASMARGLIPALGKFCDAADALNKGK